MEPAFQYVTKEEIELKGVGEIVVMGDVGCTGFDDQSKRVFDAILRTRADLFIIAGDLAFTGEKDQLAELIEFCNARVHAPVFAICGNHDLPGYAACCGLATYAMVFKRVVIVCLDNSNGRFPIGDFGFLQRELEKHGEKRFIILFHVPPPLGSTPSVMKEETWHELRVILDPHRDRIECIICAHIHGFYEYYLDGYHVFVTAGGGAAMIHELPAEGSKTHNALRVSFRDDGSTTIQMIPVPL